MLRTNKLSLNKQDLVQLLVAVDSARGGGGGGVWEGPPPGT